MGRDELYHHNKIEFKKTWLKKQGGWRNNCALNSFASEFKTLLLSDALDPYLETPVYRELLQHFKEFYKITDHRDFSYAHLKEFFRDMKAYDDMQIGFSPVLRSFLTNLLQDPEKKSAIGLSDIG